MDLIAHLKTRRSPRAASLGPPGPNADELDEMLALAVRSPDHGALAPWRFIVFEGEARARAGAAFEAIFRADQPDAGAEQCAKERERLARAPVAVAVVFRPVASPRIPEREQLCSAAAVTMNLVHAAHALGFRACWTTGWIAEDRRALAAIGVGSGETVVGFVHIGTAPEVAERPRPALAQLVTRF